jgi:hypothetical protein
VAKIGGVAKNAIVKSRKLSVGGRLGEIELQAQFFYVFSFVFEGFKTSIM